MASTTLSAETDDAHRTVRELFAFLEAQGQGDYLGEKVRKISAALTESADLGRSLNSSILSKRRLSPSRPMQTMRPC
jgi:hypothetical protein